MAVKERRDDVMRLDAQAHALFFSDPVRIRVGAFRLEGARFCPGFRRQTGLSI